ncbi:MAG TPA: hypothetical protein VFF71_04230, partial [Luteimonas sp.]|nr:hypothetical protein [Luteimonas sp.]
MSLAKPGEAGMRLGAHVIHLALAFLLAREFASGWALLPATFVFWVGLVLLSSLLDGIGRDRGGVEDTDPTTGDAAESGDAGQGMLAWPVKTPHVTLSGHDRPDDGRRQWRRHLRDVDIHFEERYRREGICTTCEFFLRAGDALALCYFPAREEDAGAGHHCDLIGPQGQRENVVVCAGAEVLL